MDQIRILHLVDNLNKDSGVMNYIMNTYRNIDREKIKFDFLVVLESDKNSFQKEINRLGGEIHKINIPFTLEFLTFQKKVEDFFSQQSDRFKAVHSHVPTLNVFFFKYAKKYGIKFRITHSHSKQSSGSKLKKIRNKILVLTLKKHSNIYLACSEDAGNFLFGKCAHSSFQVMKNGIDSKKFSFDKEIRKKYRNRLNVEEELVLGHIGRFSKEKNHDFLFRVFKEVLKVHKKSKLLLIGDGPLKEELKEKVEKLGLKNNVMFLGVRNDINELLNTMDVFILPSESEGLGLVLLEAQATGIKSLVSNTIPKEVVLSESLIEFVDLNKSDKYWAYKVIDTNKKNSRKDSSNLVKASGYDSQDSAHKLEEFYFSL